jgi:Ca2+-binding RTX toxin-like protein
MHHITRRRPPSKMIATAALTAVVALAPAAAPAQTEPAEIATATSTQTAGMRYIGTDVRNNVKVTLAGSTFAVDDIVPIHAGTGCTPVQADATKVTCVAFKEAPNGAFKRFFVDPRKGDDTVVNQTSTAGTAGARMLAIAQQGNDALVGDDKTDDDLRGSTGIDILIGLGGSDKLDGGTGEDDLDGGTGDDELRGHSDADELEGGSGDDLLDGGKGADEINGGPHGARHDRVDYSTRLNPVTVDLTRSDAPQGEAAEGDTIIDVEDVLGGHHDDTLVGSPANNELVGGEGNDHLNGREGRDFLFGGFGRDVLFPSLNADGESDFIDCDNFGSLGDDGNNGDLALRFLADGDIVNDCEQVLDA